MTKAVLGCVIGVRDRHYVGGLFEDVSCKDVYSKGDLLNGRTNGRIIQLQYAHMFKQSLGCWKRGEEFPSCTQLASLESGRGVDGEETAAMGMG